MRNQTGVIAFIFARGGSKGVPRKNLRPLGGLPLIAHSIRHALQSSLVERVVVSTDDAEIAAVARKYGAEVPFMRPAELATDTAPERQAWQHAIRALGVNAVKFFVALPPTSPLRSVADVDACIRELQNSDADIVLTTTPARRSPYFNMVTYDDQGWVRLGISGGATVIRRQDAPVMHDITTVAYAARPEHVLNTDSIFAGRVRAVTVPEDRALDIDSELDFRFAEFMLQQQQTNLSPAT